MAENRDEANVPGDPAQLDKAAKEAREGNAGKAYQAHQERRGPEAKNQPNNEHDAKENVGSPPKPEGPSTSTIRDIIGDSINLHQGTQNVYILQASYGGFDAFDSALGKFAHDDNPFRQAYRDLSRTTKRDTHLTNKDVDTQDTEVKSLETKEEIEDWYSEQLTEWEMCFVQAAAVLHGAPFHKIRDAAQTLYHPSVVGIEGTTVSRPAPKISEKTLRTHLHMKIVFTEGADRLFWYDANASGLSTFAVRLLPIIVRQSGLSATDQQGLPFLQRLEEWSTTLSGECAWRATRALGAVWIKLDMDHFLHIVNEWGTSDDPDNWRRAAILLDGAYEVEYAEQGEQVNQGNNSLVLNLLARWTRHAHASFQKNVGSTVAQAYGRIGQRSLAPALKGLNALLCYPLRSKNDREIQIPLVVFVAAAWSYVTLARFGYLRDILQHIASIVEEYCYQRHTPQGQERHEYRAQRSFMLETMFHIFFLIASASLNGAQDNVQGSYKREEQLPQHPILPGEEGQDVLLAGILSCEEAQWQQHIMLILCGAILEKNAEPTFYLLKIWAEITLKEPDPQRLMLRKALLDFLLELAKRGNQWCAHLTSIHEYDYPDLFALRYKEELQKWQVRKSGVPPQPLGAFAKDVFRRLAI